MPVALETKLYSERLACWHFAFHLVGFIGMVWMFRVWDMKQVGHFGSVLFLGVGLFVYNIARTLRRVPKWNTGHRRCSRSVWIAFAVTPVASPLPSPNAATMPPKAWPARRACGRS